MNGFIQLPGFFRKKIELKYYRVCCSECSYAETVELGRDCDNLETPRKVTELPKVCPVCGTEVTRKRIPVLIRY